MQADSTVEEIVDTIKRFRILCVGRAGVGKSSLINRVFLIDTAAVSHEQTGEANINDEFTSPENEFFVLHDSKGFEPGDTKTFETVSRFIEERSNESVLPETRLHALWLCTETPTAGGRVFETGDEELLRLAYKTKTPVVIVFTQYDRLLRTKKFELEEEEDDLDPKTLNQRSEEEAEKALAACVQSLKDAMGRMGIPMAPFAKVSIRAGYDETILSLVDITLDHVQDKLKGDAVNTWVLWAMAQRVNRRIKLRTCVRKTMDYYQRALFSTAPGFGGMLLRDCVGKVHQEIVTCWNFKDEEKILNSNEFKQLMLYLVQDAYGSQNQNESRPTLSTAFDTVSRSVGLATTVTAAGPAALPVAVISLTGYLLKWLSDAVLDNIPKVQRHLMTYAVDLIKVLESLSDFTMAPRLSGKPTWDTLQEAFQAYGSSPPCQENHRLIGEKFQRNLDSHIFHRTLCELVGAEWTPETK